VRTVSDEDFSAWARATAASGPQLDLHGYQQLLKPGIDPAPHTYSAVASGLFDTALMLPMQASAVTQSAEN
jgi:COX Aromatic Rich Motif